MRSWSCEGTCGTVCVYLLFFSVAYYTDGAWAGMKRRCIEYETVQYLQYHLYIRRNSALVSTPMLFCMTIYSTTSHQFATNIDIYLPYTL